MTHTSRHVLFALARRLHLLQRVLGFPGLWAVQALTGLVRAMLANRHVAELLRFIFLGTLVEASRLAGQKVVDFAKHFFVVKASFTRGDFAFDWVKRYLEDHRVWDQSRVFRVTACSPALRQGAHATVAIGNSNGADNDSGRTGPAAEDLADGRPHPVYQPAPKEPELFCWRGHWISVSMDLDSGSGYSNESAVQVLTLSVFSRNRKILDDFVQDARTHYFNSPLPPRELFLLPDSSGSLLTARFSQGDTSYDWMLAFISAQDEYEEITDLQVTTKQSEFPQSLVACTDPADRPLVAFRPAPRVKQRIRWGDHWLQFDVEPSAETFEGRPYGGSVTVTLHTDLINAAHEEYLKNTTSKVTVHLADRYGSWVKCVTKNRRALSTLILPEGVKEALLDDMCEFLDSEEWYTWAGVPHRRGYLLYGEPGTGKRSTIHALAGKLGLEIYFVQLASQGMDDHNLARLIAATPARCILLLEDVDCAFASRVDDTDDDDAPTDALGNPLYTGFPPRSEVTLSGLLNVLDSVSSEEGRITFATTNHIEKLDPALIRAGRMDVKIEYKLATRMQIRQTFLRFFERRFTGSTDTRPAEPSASRSKPSVTSNVGASSSHEEPALSDTEVLALAERFADLLPEHTFALAQVQGYLLTKKVEPRGAVDGAARWVEAQIEEKRRIEELKEARARKRRERKAAMKAAFEGNDGGVADRSGGTDEPWRIGDVDLEKSSPGTDPVTPERNTGEVAAFEIAT